MNPKIEIANALDSMLVKAQQYEHFVKHLMAVGVDDISFVGHLKHFEQAMQGYMDGIRMNLMRAGLSGSFESAVEHELKYWTVDEVDVPVLVVYMKDGSVQKYLLMYCDEHGIGAYKVKLDIGEYQLEHKRQFGESTAQKNIPSFQRIQESFDSDYIAALEAMAPYFEVEPFSGVVINYRDSDSVRDELVFTIPGAMVEHFTIYKGESCAI